MSLFPTFLTTSLDDVVFEGRNQAYGAYQLRHDYKQHLASAGGITLGFFALLLLSWVAWQQLAPAAVVASTKPLNPVELELKKYKFELVKPAIIAPSPAAKATPKFTHVAAPATPIMVAKDVLVPTIPTPATPVAVVDGPAGPISSPTATVEGGPGSESGPTTSSVVNADAPAVAGPYIFVEKMPEFAGGQAALLRYLQKHLRYPSPALAAQIEGRVFLSFVVQADGSIAEVTILKGLGYGLDEEAQRVVRQMPAWTPGYQSKHAVPVRFTLPITFKMQ